MEHPGVPDVKTRVFTSKTPGCFAIEHPGVFKLMPAWLFIYAGSSCNFAWGILKRARQEYRPESKLHINNM
jgi:hypothetical protein